MQTAELTGGRGWLAPAAAASVHRIDRQLGRLADVNDAGRSAEQADRNYAAWRAYLAGGPKAPYALPASKSVHCRGMAVDSDDWYKPAAAAVWRENGWRQTARYPDQPKRDEPWHGEYFPDLDRHRADPAPAGITTTPDAPAHLEEEDMPTPPPLLMQIDPKVDGRWLVVDVEHGTYWQARNGQQLDFLRATGRVEERHGIQPPAFIEGMIERGA